MNRITQHNNILFQVELDIFMLYWYGFLFLINNMINKMNSLDNTKKSVKLKNNIILLKSILFFQISKTVKE